MNNRKKIILTFGTRPEAIKMAPLYQSLMKHSDKFDTKICVTAQHRELLDQVLKVFDIVPDIDLNLMRPSQNLTSLTSAALLAMGNVFLKEMPDLVLVHGDTTTTLASSLAAFYQNIPVAHVEAGLRTHDIYSPFPEELNRQVVSKISTLHFAATNLSRENLLAENIPKGSVYVTGNTVIDALFLTLNKIDNDILKKNSIEKFLNSQIPIDWLTKRFLLITGHRRENFGEGFLQICFALKDLSIQYPQVHFIYPVHLNPNVQEPVYRILKKLHNIHLIPPLDYEPFVYLLKHCYLVLTDSGGIQEEAPSLGKPVLVMREVTERPEAVEAGTVRLVGANRERIVANVTELIENEACYQKMARAHNPYGDGNACSRIIEALGMI